MKIKFRYNIEPSKVIEVDPSDYEFCKTKEDVMDVLHNKASDHCYWDVTMTGADALWDAVQDIRTKQEQGA